MYVGRSMFVYDGEENVLLLSDTEKKEVRAVKSRKCYYHHLQLGLSNKLRTLFGFLFISMEEENSIFYLTWRNDHYAFPGVFEDLFEGKIKNVVFLEDQKNISWWYEKKICHLLLKSAPNSIDVVKELSHKFKSSFTSREDLEVFKKVKIKKSILEKIIQYYQSTLEHKNVIGIHIRRTDHKKSNPPEYCLRKLTDEYFQKKMDEEIRKNEDVKFFLSTDNSETQKRFQSIFGKDRIIFYQEIDDSGSDKSHRKTSMEHALIDLVLLSRTQKVIKSCWSSFSDMADRMNKVRKREGYDSFW